MNMSQSLQNEVVLVPPLTAARSPTKNKEEITVEGSE